MPRSYNYEKSFEDCMKEMFKRVGLKFSVEFCQGKDWYMSKSWTTAQQNEFRKWMEKLLKKRHGWGAHQLNKEVGMFILCYGWKQSD
jgi:hypothetical protein